jgi:HSP20 family protein
MFLFNDLHTWNPWREMARMNRDFDRMFNSTQSAAALKAPINIYTDGDGARVVAQLPGWNSDWIDLTAEGNKVLLKGERPKDALGGAMQFERTVTLPFHFDSNSVRAGLKDGLLTIEVHKHEQEKPKKIAIEAA